MNEIEPSFGYWLSGFIDGEGCFSISRRGLTERYQPRFDLFLRIDDLPTIKEIHQTMGIGAIGHRKGRSLSHPVVGWHVSKKVELLDLVAFVNQFPLRAKKKSDFEIWSEAVIEYNLPRTDRDWEKIGALYTDLKASRKAALTD